MCLLSITLSRCILPNYYDVYYVNNTDFDIRFNHSFGYPDTTISFKTSGEIKAGSHIVVASGSTIEEQITQISSDTLSIFYFHPDTLKKYSWEEIQQNYKILRRYDLSIENFSSLKNKYGVPEIPYPPTEAMKNMKMYPPYGK
jgi:hypothetical protein